MKTILIIPAYNEEESLKNTIEELARVAGDVDYIIVNDGSTDNTAQICRQEHYPLLDLPINLGLAGAFQAGMKYAYEHDYDCAIQFDADGQHRPEYVKDLAARTEIDDIVIGSRFVNQPKPSSLRMFGSWIIEKAIKLTTHTVIKDPTSGMRAFNKRMIKILALGTNLGPEPDTVSYLIRRANASVSEVSVEMRERYAGESYLNLTKSCSYMFRITTSILFIQFLRKKIGDE